MAAVAAMMLEKVTNVKKNGASRGAFQSSISISISISTPTEGHGVVLPQKRYLGMCCARGYTFSDV